LDEPPSYELLSSVIAGIGLTYALGLGALGLLLASALVSASERALFSSGGNGILLTGENKNRKDRIIAAILKNPGSLLATIRTVRITVNIAFITCCVFLLWIAGIQRSDAIAIAGMVLLASFAIVVFGEIIPRVAAGNSNLTLARRTASFWNMAVRICRPLAGGLNAIDRSIENRIEAKGYYKPDELDKAFELANGGGTGTGDEKDILKGIVNFGTLTVRQVMRSRIDIGAVNVEMNFHELMDYINKSGFSRMPVYRETIDHIEGVLYIKDLLPFTAQEEGFKWQELLRPCFFIPENKKIDSLLKDFQEKRVHMALVVDEYGGILGLITLEDIIEEIIGEINDEFDEEVHEFRKIDDRTYVFEGKTLLHDLCKTLDVEGDIFDPVRGESESLGGLILELTNSLPNVGRKIDYKLFTFTIEAVDKRRIKRVRVHIHERKES
jgi:gliding motility-associated protein GldE